MAQRVGADVVPGYDGSVRSDSRYSKSLNRVATNDITLRLVPRAIPVGPDPGIVRPEVNDDTFKRVWNGRLTQRVGADVVPGHDGPVRPIINYLYPTAGVPGDDIALGQIINTVPVCTNSSSGRSTADEHPVAPVGSSSRSESIGTDVVSGEHVIGRAGPTNDDPGPGELVDDNPADRAIGSRNSQPRDIEARVAPTYFDQRRAGEAGL